MAEDKGKKVVHEKEERLPIVTIFSIEQLKAFTSDFSGTNRIGSGGFSHIYKGTIRGRQYKELNGQEIAVKVSRKLDEETRTQWHAEINYLPKFNHPNIIKLIGQCETSEALYLVYPFMKKGTVKSKLADLGWSTTLNIIKGVALALRELHSHMPPLIFRDLKPANLLLDKNFTPKLADFGTVTPEGEVLKIGTLGYTDYIVMTNGIGTKPTDIFSFGVVVLKLLTKKEKVSVGEIYGPAHIGNWAYREYHELRNDIVHNSFKMTRSYNKSAARTVMELGLACVSRNLQDRPTIDDALHKLEQLDDQVTCCGVKTPNHSPCFG